MPVTNFEKASLTGDYSDHLRVVILGKTGNGKSSTINQLIGESVFKTVADSSSVTQTCEGVSFELSGQKVLLVDTPGKVASLERVHSTSFISYLIKKYKRSKRYAKRRAPNFERTKKSNRFYVSRS
jgi:predicted GTPase